MSWKWFDSLTKKAAVQAQKFTQSVNKAASAAKQKVTQTVSAVKKTVSSAVTAVKKTVSKAVTAVKQKVTKTVAAIKKKVANAVTAVKKKLVQAKKLLQSAVKATKAAAKKLLTTAKATAKQALKTAKGTAKKVIQAGKAAGRQAKAIVKRQVGKVFTDARKLKNNLTQHELVKRLKKDMNRTLLSTKSFVKGAGKGAWGAVLSTKDSVVALATDPVGTAKGVVTGVWDTVSNPEESFNNFRRDLEGLYYQMKDGNAETRGQLLGNFVTSAFLDKGVGKVLKVTPKSQGTPKPKETQHPTQGMDEAAKDTSKKKLLPGEGNIGTYKELNDAGSVGDDITPHHMPSKEYLVRKLGWNSKDAKNDGMSINVEQPKTGGRHRRTETYGRNMTDKEKASYYSLEPRDALAFDLRNLRNIYKEDGLYKEILPSLREYAKQAREDYYKKYLIKKK